MHQNCEKLFHYIAYFLNTWRLVSKPSWEIKEKLDEFDLAVKYLLFDLILRKPSLHNAACQVFPRISLESCFYYFSLVNFQKPFELGLWNQYVIDIEIGIKVACSLPWHSCQQTKFAMHFRYFKVFFIIIKLSRTTLKTLRKIS